MKWYAISGSWRNANEEVERDVDLVVKKILARNNGIVTGGALGVDYIATQTVLDVKKTNNNIRIYLPISLSLFINHYHNRANEGVITYEQSNKITNQLETIYKLNPNAIFDKTSYTLANEESYYIRNTTIIKNCNVLYAFHINKTKGTQDAIDKAKSLNKKVFVREYKIK